MNVRQVRRKIEWTPDGEYEGWWPGPLRKQDLHFNGYRTIDEAVAAPVRVYFSNGPMLIEGVRQNILDRVIGILRQ